MTLDLTEYQKTLISPMAQKFLAEILPTNLSLAYIPAYLTAGIISERLWELICHSTKSIMYKAWKI